MEHFTYLIIGGGEAADSAARGIRELDRTGRIGLISKEQYPPYERPPLSKGLWMGKQVNEIWKNTALENIVLHLGREIVSIKTDTHTVTDDVGNVYSYEKLLLATGAAPKKLKCEDEDVIYYRSVDHYYKLRALYDKCEDFVVIGSGFIGTEVAASLAMNGKKVTMIFREPHIGSKSLPTGFSNYLNDYYKENNVNVICNQTVSSVKKEGEKYTVQTSNGDVFYTDGVIAGLGVSPQTELAESIDLNITDGIVVDRYLQTSESNIFAAGDVANFYSPHLDKRLRIEHVNAANSMGRTSGRNMAGAKEEYNYLPFFYSDLFEIGYEAIGELDNNMEIIEDWHDLYRKGVLYYLKDNRVRGAILIGIWDQTDKIREMIALNESVTADALVGKISI